MSRVKARRGRFEYVPGQHRPRPVRTGLLALLGSAALLYAGFTASIPFLPKGGTEVKAVFEHAANARAGTHVRVHGVTVGKVEEVEPGPGGRGALITMRIDDEEDVRLKEDARAHIWWRTLLGRNMYIDLVPGSPSAPDLGERTIPVERTTYQTEFDELLTVLDPTARKSVQTMLSEFDEGFGDPEAVNDLLDELGPAMRSTGPAVRALRGTESGDLNRLVTSASRTLGALARDERALGGFIDHGATALGVTAARRADLGATLGAAPAALRQTRTTMTRLRTTLDELDPLARALRPGARRLDPALRDAEPMLASLDTLLAKAEPMLTQLRPTSQALEDVVADARPLVEETAPVVERTKTGVIPVLNKKSPDTTWTTVQGVGPVMSAIASAAQQYDVYGHVMRFQAGASEQFVGPAPCSTVFLDPTAEEKVNCELLMETFGAALGIPPTQKLQKKVVKAESRKVEGGSGR